MTTIGSFRASISAPAPPPGLDPALQALWWVRKGDWNQAHAAVQEHEGNPDCDHVHAHLHRHEGDAENAAYWYRRARRPIPAGPLPEEWDAIAADLLSREASPQAATPS